jgi:hypothetical protein
MALSGKLHVRLIGPTTERFTIESVPYGKQIGHKKRLSGNTYACPNSLVAQLSKHISKVGSTKLKS